MKFLMVCLGNICRSPLAEGILQEIIDANHLPWEVDSAATGSWHIGKSPDSRSIDIAKIHGLSIHHQKARQFSIVDFDQFDLILAMDQSNYQNIIRLTSSEAQKEKVKLIMDFSSTHQKDVPDPYWGDDGFENIYLMLKEACDALMAHYSK